MINKLLNHAQTDPNFKYHAMIVFGMVVLAMGVAFLAQLSIIHAGAVGYAVAYFTGAGIEDKQTIDRWDSGDQNSNQERFLDKWCTTLTGFALVSVVLVLLAVV